MSALAGVSSQIQAEAAADSQEAPKAQETPKSEEAPKAEEPERRPRRTSSTGMKALEAQNAESAAALEAAKAKIPEDLSSSIVTISDSSGGGTGFFAYINERYFVVTNVHVIGGIKTPKIEDIHGGTVPVNAVFVAADRDIAIIPVAALPEGCKALEMEMDIAKKVKRGDYMAAFGNSLASGVILPSYGKVVGIGPKFVETDCAIYPGNSGSPFFHADTGKVIGVFTYVQTINTDNERISRSMGSESSSIKSNIRYLGYRFDNVSSWQQSTQAQLYKMEEEMEGFEDKLRLYYDFFKMNRGNLTSIKVPPNAAEVNPEFGRIARKLGNDGISTRGFNASRTRFSNALASFYKDFDFMLGNEKRKLANLKLHPHLEREKKAALDAYDHYVALVKEQLQSAQ